MRVDIMTTLQGDGQRPQLVKERGVNYEAADSLNSPEKIERMLNEIFRLSERTEEHGYLVCFNTKYRVTGIFEISQGGVNFASLSNREIFSRALLCGAASIAVVHNHPSGDVTPSTSDLRCAERIQKAGDLMGIKLSDFLIVGEEGFFSFAEAGLLTGGEGT